MKKFLIFVVGLAVLIGSTAQSVDPCVSVPAVHYYEALRYVNGELQKEDLPDLSYDAIKGLSPEEALTYISQSYVIETVAANGYVLNGDLHQEYIIRYITGYAARRADPTPTPEGNMS